MHMKGLIDIHLYCSLSKYLLSKTRGSEIAFTSLCVHNLQREEWNSNIAKLYFFKSSWFLEFLM